jgi:DNA-directed RNA polymerase specialized sigma24 family protein
MNTTIDAYEQFVRARTPALLRTAYLLTGDQHLAEDLVQEALSRTHRAWPRLRDSGNVEAYTRKVMYHAQVSRWRRRRVAEAMPGDLPDVAGRGTGDHASLAALRITLGRALLGPHASAPAWCCASSRIAPRSRRPNYWASRSAP